MDASTATRKMVFTVFGVVAELERSLIAWANGGDTVARPGPAKPRHNADMPLLNGLGRRQASLFGWIRTSISERFSLSFRGLPSGS